MQVLPRMGFISVVRWVRSLVALRRAACEAAVRLAVEIALAVIALPFVLAFLGCCALIIVILAWVFHP